ncbi:unnamed protein product [Hydatigera taeniaeformis]|uniref:Serine/threonine-protein phosphatase n=1 Tax=Hydatigena taeniaeformis TaxID=6205 RepID=A0A0R3WN34_HYDTA|nr:unnamed protein product [Hydatigera taeniaeformis]
MTASQSQLPFDVIPDVDLDTILDSLINHLREGFNTPGRYVNIERRDIELVCSNVVGKFMNEPMMLELECPVTIIGDVHGQFFDLLRIFHQIGFPPEQQYLCLGDYVDRGPQSIETVTLLFAYKLKYPHNIYLLRGNHECERLCKTYGFKREIVERYNDPKMLDNFVVAFNHMPIAALIDDSFLCMHGGISKELMKPNVTDLRGAINSIPRPVDVPLKGLMCDLLWSDPMPEKHPSSMGWERNPRGCSYLFDCNVLLSFVEKYNIVQIFRAHQYFREGYKRFHARLMSIFSAPNYMNSLNNNGVSVTLSKGELGYQAKLTVFKPSRVDYVVPFMV